jgi:chemotaxis protein CheX
MDRKILTPFINATVSVMSTMAQTVPCAGAPYQKEGKKSWGSVTGLIGLMGTNITGNMVLSFEDATIIDIVNKMLMEQFSAINQEISDAVGEITNMVAGGAKRELSDFGYSISMATPMVIVGKDIQLTQLSSDPVFVVPFQTNSGRFVLETNIVGGVS